MTTEPNIGLEKSIIETIVSDTYEKSPVKDRKIILEIRETATRYISEAINKASQASREEMRKEIVLDMWDNTFMDKMCAKRDCIGGFTTEEAQQMTDEWILVWKKVMGDMHIET